MKLGTAQPFDAPMESEMEGEVAPQIEEVVEPINPHDLAAEFSAMVGVLAKPGAVIVEQLTPAKAHLLHMALGVSSDSGELLDAVKKHAVHNKALDITNVIEELGDIEFFLEGLRSALGITRERVLTANMEKLLTGKNARYASGAYSDAEAAARSDKIPPKLPTALESAAALQSTDQPTQN